MAPSATACSEDTGTTGMSSPQARPCTTPVAILTPVKEPGPQAKARASSSAGARFFSARSSRTIGINSRVWPLGASSKRSEISPSTRRAAEQPSDDVSSANSFTGVKTSGQDANLFEFRQDLVANAVQTANALDTDVFRCRGWLFRRPVLVVANQRCSLVVVDFQTLANRLFLVVLTLNQRLSGLVVLTLDLGRIVFHMVDTTASLMHPATGQTADNFFVIHGNFDHIVDGNSLVFQSFSLGDGPRETVEQETVLAIRLLNTLFDQRNDDVVRHQAACCHDFLYLLAQLGLGFHRRTQHVTGGDLGNIKPFSNELGLSPLACARRA
mmetsp:Transcript_11996/g.18054  ORF Transcript_11996/g.18054 Transcript_11996/m.18054 type:complete len:326 (+) Transcript_11996:371-1348(+)